MRRASVVLSGGKPNALSLNTSTSVPPVPKSSTGPNCGSGLATDNQLVAIPKRSIGCTVTPRKSSALYLVVTACSIVLYA
jgi:hypothetical protein